MLFLIPHYAESYFPLSGEAGLSSYNCRFIFL